jgi:gas vesicle protein
MDEVKAEKHTGKWIAGMVSAALVGAALGVLFAPKSGRETRELLRAKVNDARTKMNNKAK